MTTIPITASRGVREQMNCCRQISVFDKMGDIVISLLKNQHFHVVEVSVIVWIIRHVAN